MTTKGNGAKATTPTLDPTVLRESVQSRSEGQGSPLEFYGTDYLGRSIDTLLLGWSEGNRLPLSRWWSPARDRELRSYVRKSTALGGITYGRVTAIKNLDWRLVADDKTLDSQLDDYYAIFEHAQFGEGFRTCVGLYTTDNYTQDNGSFIELIGKGVETQHVDTHGNRFTAKGMLKKEAIEGFASLDAAWCFRTYNREWPVVYTNPWTGQIHILHWTRVIARAQFPQAYELGRGVGVSAASRAFQALEIMQASNDYIYEKMTGQSPELAIAVGVALRAIDAAVQDGEIQADNKGLVRYKGLSFIEGDFVPGVKPEIIKVGIKDVPDGWDRDKEMTLAIYLIAMAYATDARDLGWPATQTGATKADAEIQDLKTSGRGRSDTIRDLEEVLTTRVLPKGIRLEFDVKDDLEDKRKAEIAKIRAETRAIQISSGELDVNEAREMAAQQGDIDAGFLETRTIIEGDSNPSATEANSSPVDDQDTPIDTMDDEAEEAGVKAYNSDVRIPFQDRLLQLLLSDMNPFALSGEIDYLFRIYGQRAYLDGVNDGGAKGIVEISQLEPEERSEMNGLISQNVSYALGLAVDMQEAPLEEKQRRAHLWANKGLDSLYNAGLLAGNENAALEWIYGDRVIKHCPDCKRYNGRVYRAKTWKKYGIQPKADTLACKGFNCECELRRTDKPIKRGRPPLPSGARGKAWLEKNSSLYQWYLHRGHTH